ncbi:MAG: tetratricopeptide repeat protein [Acidobacteriota bacterium]
MDNATKRQLKKQDQFHNITEHGLDWAKSNRQSAISLIVGIVGVVLVLVGGYSLYAHRTEAAATAFGDAMQVYQTPLANPAQPTPPGMKTFQTAKERAEAANPKFVEIASRYGMTKSGRLAEYFAGLTYMEEGQNQSAEDALKKVSGSWDGGVAALAKMALAEFYEHNGRYDEAAGLYTELGNGNAATVPPGLAKIELGEMYEAQGKVDQARKLYAEVKDKDKDDKGKAGPAGELAAQKLNPVPVGGLPGQ